MGLRYLTWPREPLAKDGSLPPVTAAKWRQAALTYGGFSAIEFGIEQGLDPAFVLERLEMAELVCPDSLLSRAMRSMAPAPDDPKRAWEASDRFFLDAMDRREAYFLTMKPPEDAPPNERKRFDIGRVVVRRQKDLILLPSGKDRQHTVTMKVAAMIEYDATAANDLAMMTAAMNGARHFTAYTIDRKLARQARGRDAR